MKVCVELFPLIKPISLSQQHNLWANKVDECDIKSYLLVGSPCQRLKAVH